MTGEILTDLANAPAAGLLIVVVILSMAILALIIRAWIKSNEVGDTRSDNLLDDFRIEAASLKGQIELLDNHNRKNIELAVRAQTRLEAIEQRSKLDQGEIEALKGLLTRTQARIIQLVNTLVENGIMVPDEATIAGQAAVVKEVPKPEGAEPLSTVIEVAKTSPPLGE